MARNSLIQTVESNATCLHEEAPVSNFKRRVDAARRAEVLAQENQDGHEDIRDNPFHGLMTSNRGVL